MRQAGFGATLLGCLGLLATTLSLAWSGPGLAQQSRGGQSRPAPRPSEARSPEARSPEVKSPEKEPPAPEPPPAPYDRDLLRLSEIIGSLAFLRDLCATPDAAEWPARMKALMEAEGVTPSRRDRLAGAYNRGYRGYSLTYRVCTPAATEAAGRFVAEGERLSHALASRFGG